MQTMPLTIPRPVPLQKFRAPKKNVPQTVFERNRILQVVRDYVKRENPVPPLPTDELKKHADAIVAFLKCDPIYRDYIGVLVNNELWRESLASIPFERRLLLLPKCLRVESKCPAPFDEFGLLCKSCGLCSIQDLQVEAERLGYAVLVAEGSAIVMSLIQTGKIEAIVGVSCLPVLEKSFPYMEAAAIPGVAIPLLQDDCIDTNVDLDWVWDYIHLTSDDKTRRLDLTGLRDEVQTWFTLDSMNRLMGDPQGHAETIAREWLARAGKRWRPFLTTAVYQALRSSPEAVIPDDLKRISIAVECFHKASLIHDDIEDQDKVRYGEQTLHEQYGQAVALNVGDLLIGEGYRLIGATTLSANQKTEMMMIAAEGQRELCRGQGTELGWANSPKPLTSLEVLQIFRQKTAPAFEVALRFGAVFAGGDESVHDALKKYSEALGIAYQIRDDVNDFQEGADANDITGMRPTLLLAVAYERANGEKRALLEKLWKRDPEAAAKLMEVVGLYQELKADERAKLLYETYKEEAIRSLSDVEHPNIKGLLRRVIGKIFNDTEIKGWCKEFEQKNGVTREVPIPLLATAV
jgi:geranylgeranyl diphosphate synthase type II